MLRRLVSTSAILALLLGLLPATVLGQAAPADVVADQYIVVLQATANTQAEARAAERAQGLQVLQVYEHALNGFAFKGSAQAAQALARNPQVKFVSQDRVVEAFAQTLPTGVDRIDADVNSTAGIDGTDQRINANVAIIDTGIDLTHPDLNVLGGRNCSTGNSYQDGNGHGSHVAGTVAGLDNGSGVVGVAPGARLWAARVLNNAGSGTWSSVICGVDWVTSTRTDSDPGNDIAVANMSLGGGGSDDGNCGTANSDALHQAICGSVARGVVYVVAAGNSGADAAGSVPAAYAEVLTVSAVADYDGQLGGLGSPTCANQGGDDRLASFSNYGRVVDIAAPGVCILSTYKGGGYATLSGTSMATPHVTGAVALYVANNGPATSAAGVATIRQHVTDPSRGYSVAQSDPRGFSGDKDAYPEPMLYLGPGGAGPVHDVAVTGVSVPASVLQGDSATVAVSLANQGTSGETFDVTLTDSTANAPIGSQSVSLAAGASTTVSFTWTTTSATAIGSHSLTATAAVVSGETNTANNSRSATTNVTAQPTGGALDMYVGAIGFSERRFGKKGSNADLMTTVTVRGDSNNSGTADPADAAVAQAQVQLTLTAQSGGSWSFAGSTNDAGQVTFTLKFAQPGTYTATVTGVTHSSYAYASALNLETSDSYTLP